MAGNIFDQFDAKASSDNPFDQFDEVPKKSSRSAANIAKDVGVTALKGAIGLPESIVGLADIPTGGRVGRALESVGFRPGEAQKILDEQYSEQTKEAKKYVNEADGFVDTVVRAIERPSTIATSVGESIPSMIGGAGIARGAMKVLPKLSPIIAGAIGEGAISAGQSAEQIRQESKDGTLTAKQSAIATASGIGTGILGFVGGKIASSKLGQKLGIVDIDTMLASGEGRVLSKGFIRQVVGSGISEGVFEELPQSAQEQMWQNYATGKPVMDGVPQAAAQGMLAGASMGGAGGGYNAMMAPRREQNAGLDTQQPLPSSGDNQSPIQAADVLDTPVPATTLQQPAPAVPIPEENKALYSPKPITALDRVAEIDATLFDAQNPVSDAESMALGNERAKITASWPKAQGGAQTSFTTETGARLDGQYALVEAGDLTTSHDENLRPVATYPAELQPRERERHASEIQIQGIVGKLDPARLGESADVATGAPIVGADGLVESGNARTIALKRVYQANGQKAEDYRTFLKNNSARFGIVPEQIDAMQKPVLVRVRQTPVNRAEFARQANQSTVARMSPSEQAKSDAAQIDSLEDLSPNDQGDFMSSASNPFIRRFLAKLPATEQSGLIDAAGRLSQAGYSRIRNAVLAKAYGDSPVLTRMVESLDDNLRNVGKALMRVAPVVAKAREAIAEGAMFDADIVPDLMAAVEELSDLKERGISVDESLSQAGMFGEKLTPEARDLLKFLSDNLRRPNRIAEFVQNYIETLAAAGNPNQGTLLGEATAPAKGDLMAAANRGQDGTIQDSSRPDAGKDEGAGQQDQRQSADAERGIGSTQGDEAADEWVAFPPETGTLGIPRADMPQIKGEHRGALMQFLEGKGVSHESEEVPAKSLRPTQAEFSREKVAKWEGAPSSAARSVLVSSDGYILDGHHQWIAALAANEPVSVIRLNAPILPLLELVDQFPSVKRSGGGVIAARRAENRQEFKAAMADLADILTPYTRAAMLPEDTPNLMPTLVRLFDVGIREIGYSLKDLIAYVKKALRNEPEFKKNWNKISDATLKKAAQQAIDKSHSTLANGDLFGAIEKAQGDLFSQPQGDNDGRQVQRQGKAPTEEVKSGAAMINGRPYDMKSDNYTPQGESKFIGEEILSRAKALIDRVFTQGTAPVVPVSAKDRERAQENLRPLLKLAEEAKTEYDQKIIDIAKRVGAVGQMLAPVKGIMRAAEKLVTDNKFDHTKMRDLLRSTIVVNSYAEAQAVLDAIGKEFTIQRVKNKTDLPLEAPSLVVEKSPDGYMDVLVNVAMPNGTIAEIQINVPSMMAAKMGSGHKLYEIARVALDGAPEKAEAEALQKELYAATLEAARKSASEISDQRSGHQSVGSIPSQGDRSLSTNFEPSGNLTYSNSTPSSSVKSRPNLQPSGNLDGTFISDTSTQNIAQGDIEGQLIEIVRGIAEARPFDAYESVRDEALDRVAKVTGKAFWEHDALRGSMMRDPLAEAIHEGRYRGMLSYAKNLPVRISDAAISTQEASSAFSGTSHSPEQRGASVRRGVFRDLMSLWRGIEPAYNAATPDLQAEFVRAFNETADHYTSMVRAYLSSHSRVMSSMIVGPARFPVETNRKKSAAADKRSQEAAEFLRKAPARLAKVLRGPIDNSLESQLAEAEHKLVEREKQQSMMKSANAALRKGDDKALSDLGFDEARITELKKPDFAGRTGFADFRLANNNAEIKRLRQRVEDLRERAGSAGEESGAGQGIAAGVRMVKNSEANRLQLFFDDKPGEAVREDLRGSGFKWAPSQSAWQRQLTSNAIAAAERIISKHYPTVQATTDPVTANQMNEVHAKPKLSRGTGSGMALRDLQAVVDRVSKGFKNLPRVHVFESPDKLSTNDPAQKALRDYIKQAGAMDDVEGATHNGEIYLFASGLSDESRAEHVLATHEITHYGLRGSIGKELDSALQHVLLMNAAVRKEATRLKARLGLKSNLAAVEEVLADMPNEALVELRGWRKVVQAIRNWLDKAGATALAKKLDGWITAGLDDQQKADLFVADLVRSAREWVKSGKGTATTDTMLADKTLAEDIAGQEAWLTKEAKARGYQSIDELAEKDYPVFENLAALWRKKNPVEGALLSRGDITNTSAFKKWFGDSKVVDAEGKPLVVYHGTKGDFSAFEIGRETENSSTFGAYKTERLGLFFAEDPSFSDEFAQQGDKRQAGANVMPLYLSIQNPLDLTEGFQGLHKNDFDKIHGSFIKDNYWAVNLNADEIWELFDRGTVSAEDFIAAIKDAGFDGVKMIERNAKKEATGVWVALDPTQVKSAIGNRGTFDPNNPDIRFSRATQAKTIAEQADDLISKPAATPRPFDAIMRGAVKATMLDKATTAIYRKAGGLLDRYTPEMIKAGMVADYGIPEAVLDRRAITEGRQRQQLRGAGALLEKLSTLTRAESRVAYEWMNSQDPESAEYFRQQLPEESVKVLAEVEKMIDALSKEAVSLGQLDHDAYKRNRFAYLRRSYVKHTVELTQGEAKARGRAISILGDQYKGRGMSDAVDMSKVKNAAPEWWKRKLQDGKADKGIKGEKFVRLERRAPSGEGTQAMPGIGDRSKGKLLEVAYWPADVQIPARLSTWDHAGTWEVRDTKGDKLIVWRDFTKQEREALGEIDEARFAIAKTLHGMIHDVETGRYLQWLSQNYAKIDGDAIDGTIVEASEKLRDVFKPSEWVKVPDSTIPGTKVKKYGDLAGKYLPGPIWNDVRQMSGRVQPLGETYATIMRVWKMAKTSLSPGVHTNNVMANFVMADWHDVSAGHVIKALRLITSKDPVAKEVVGRYTDAGGGVGTWATKELMNDQLRPLLEELEKELGQAAETTGQAGVFAALQLALHRQFPEAWQAFKTGRVSKVTVKAGRAMMDLYEAEDTVFRLAAWLKAKEEGSSDLDAGKVARKSFLDYSINAPWVQMMRATAFPFIAFTYRSVPMLIETAAKKPWKLMKLGLFAGLLNALGYAGSGGDEDEERKLLPEEKAGTIWGIVPKLIRMPWNDAHGSPVFLDIRRWIPVGDIFDTGQTNAAVPILPAMVPGGPLSIMAELALNKQGFTGKEITQETDTSTEKAQKLVDYLYKAFAPNLIFLPGTYAFTGVMNAGTGKTDSFGREQSLAQSVVSSVGVKVGSYPSDVARQNIMLETKGQMVEIQRNMSKIGREYMRKGITEKAFQEKIAREQEKLQDVMKKTQKRIGAEPSL